MRQYRDFDLVLHAATDFSPARRAKIDSAARKLTELTKRNARVTVVYDVDFSSTSNLQEHTTLHHFLVVDVPEGGEIAKGLPSGAAAATAHLSDGSARVYFIEGQVAPENFEEVAMHEFGHVVGMKDLPIRGAVMSAGGWSRPEFVEADVVECRRVMLCE